MIRGREEKPKLPKPTLSSIRLGVWKLYTSVDPPFELGWRVKNIKVAFPLFRRLAVDIYQLSPTLVVFYLCTRFWTGIESALLMHFSSRLLQIIEICITEGRSDTRAILSAIIARLACVILVAFLGWWSDKLLATLKSRIVSYFNTLLMREKLRIDLPTSTDPRSHIRTTANGAWSAFEQIIRFSTEILNSLSQLALITHVSRTAGGPLFVLLCVAKPAMETLYERSLWDLVCVAFVDNIYSKRMKALEKLTTPDYREDIISGDLGGYILNEYSAAREKVGDTPNDHPIYQYSSRSSPAFLIVSGVLGDLPMVYCAISAILFPSKFSVASIAILQQSSNTLRTSFEVIFSSTESFRRSVNTLKDIYATSDTQNQIVDGQLSYPQADPSVDQGMKLEFRNVSFSYPGSVKTSLALNNVSFTIKPGQLVIIVGENGGGKSTIIKLLSRLYDPTSGEYLIDDRPAGGYQMSKLRQATATFSQDNIIYPLSLGENIGLGYSECASNEEMIAEAAKQGGALSFVSKLSDKFQTELDPQNQTFVHNIPKDKDHPIVQKLEEVRRSVNISGGERQRIVASRTFMRFQSGKIKFVAVDEPSSAIDAEGELQLFENLIEVRKGKTMVFVTHRFGHLTKYADQIICMKDGEVAECGTHDELIKSNGEYLKLYNIQASAFQVDSNNSGTLIEEE